MRQFLDFLKKKIMRDTSKGDDSKVAIDISQNKLDFVWCITCRIQGNDFYFYLDLMSPKQFDDLRQSKNSFAKFLFTDKFKAARLMKEVECSWNIAFRDYTSVYIYFTESLSLEDLLIRKEQDQLSIIVDEFKKLTSGDANFGDIKILKEMI